MSPYRGSELQTLPEGIVRYFRVDRRDLVYLKFILEAYEGMSTLSTVEPQGVIVRLSIPSGFEADVQSIIDSVGVDIAIHEVTFGSGEAANA
jgi:hypothetical protein